MTALDRALEEHCALAFATWREGPPWRGAPMWPAMPESEKAYWRALWRPAVAERMGGEG